MKELLRSQWNYMLCQKNDDLIFSVICGTIGLFEVNIILNSNEVNSFKEKGEEYLKELAEQIRSSPSLFNDRHIDIKKD